MMMNNELDDLEKAEDVLLKKLEEERKQISELEKANRQKRIFFLKISVYVQILIIIIASILIAKQYPQFSVSIRPQKVLRIGTYDTDEKTDECISNIWKLKSNPKLKLKCPVCALEYKIVGNNIYCPCPDAHGFKKIYSTGNSAVRLE